MSGPVYWDKSQMQNDGATPSILAIGDSWFWYPLIGGSLIVPLGDLVASKGHTIYCLGNNGAEAIDYTQGRYRRTVLEALRLYGSVLSAVFISGGGNDLAGRDDLLPMLNVDCSAAQTAQDCFRAGNDTGTLNEMISRVDKSTQKLIAMAQAVMPTQSTIYLHPYDYGYPDGRGALGGSAWLRPALEEANVPVALHRPAVKLVIDRFAEIFGNIATASSGRVIFVDSRGTLTRSTQWANELHPTPAGFKRIAVGAWEPLLVADNLA
jgi:hypothetical protein